VSEWPKEADCKSAGKAYVGSNPSRPTKHIERDTVVWTVSVRATLLWLPVGFATTGAIQPYRALGFVERQPIDVVLAWAPMRSTPSRRAGIAPPAIRLWPSAPFE
jgi:hypothetical protein